MSSFIIGQYFEADSLLHRADPRFKLVFALVYFVAVFVAPGFAGLAFMAVFTAVLVALSQVPLKVVFKTIMPLLFILAFTVLLNLFFTTTGEVYWHWGIFTISDDGIYRAVFFPLRITLLLVGMSLLTLTTSPLDITDASESLMQPLRHVGVPVHELSMMLGIALRFLPVFVDEFVKIKRAQESRGADFGSGNIVRRARALVPLMVPLFTSAFRHSEGLAQAMESRCYHGGEGRTRMRVLTAGAADYRGLALFICVLLIAITLRIVATLGMVQTF